VDQLDNALPHGGLPIDNHRSQGVQQAIPPLLYMRAIASGECAVDSQYLGTDRRVGVQQRPFDQRQKRGAASTQEVTDAREPLGGAQGGRENRQGRRPDRGVPVGGGGSVGGARQEVQQAGPQGQSSVGSADDQRGERLEAHSEDVGRHLIRNRGEELEVSFQQHRPESNGIRHERCRQGGPVVGLLKIGPSVL